MAALVCLSLKWLIPDTADKIGGIFTSGAGIVAITMAAAAVMAACGFLFSVRWTREKEF